MASASKKESTNKLLRSLLLSEKAGFPIERLSGKILFVHDCDCVSGFDCFCFVLYGMQFWIERLVNLTLIFLRRLIL